jgi:hypothetical protein
VSPITPLKILGLAGFGIAILGSFLPWVTYGPVGRAGTDGDGIFTLAAGVLGGLLLLFARGRGWTIAAALLAAAIVGLTGFYIADAPMAEEGTVTEEAGSGLFLTFLGGVFAAIGSFWYKPPEAEIDVLPWKIDIGL